MSLPSREALTNKLREKLLDDIRQILNGELITISCLSCAQFNEAQEICGLFKQRPPARIIARGCSEYIDREYVPY